jgi:hypothetical protein
MRIGAAVPLVVLAAAALQGQSTSEPQGARELFYNAMVRKDSPPPARRAAPSSRGGTSTGGRAGVAITPVSLAAVHLGIRYNLVLVDADSGKTQAAAADRMFHAGECFAIELESNRAGFLYVLAKQSSGSWHPLLPSTDPDMATENNVITPGVRVRIPLQHCFEIQNPPGAETLFVVLSREPRDSFELYENLKAPEKPRRPSVAVEVADAAIADGTVARMREEFGTRDITIKKISQPLAAAEPQDSVYVVNSSSNPVSNLAAQIEIHHR